MYAVIESGGKQYRVAVGDRLKVESLQAKPGAEVQLENVLLVADGDKLDMGSPYTGASVGAKVVEHGRGPKLRILKFRRRKNSRQRAGHRQNYTELEITSISDPGTVTQAPEKADAKTERTDDKAAKTPSKSGEKATKKAAAPAKPAGDDDLTQLNGIGPVLAEKLKESGVTSLTQIAGWTEEDVNRFDEELNSKGRIQRDDWVGQAGKLIKKTD